jgi:hypothetical protein
MTAVKPSPDSPPVTEAANSTAVVLALVEEFGARGWDLRLHAPSLSLSTETSGDGRSLASALLSLGPLMTSGRLDCDLGAGSIELKTGGDGAGPLVITAHSDADPLVLFSDADLEDGRAALGGDVEAALKLSGRWKAEVDIDPAKALKVADTDHEWLVLQNPRAFADLVLSRPWWELSPLFQQRRPTVVALYHSSSPFHIATGRMQIISLSDLGRTPFTTERGSIGATTLDAPTAGTPDPRVLVPESVQGSEEDIEIICKALWRQASASCWAHLASSVHIGSTAARLEYFGLQRQAWNMPSIGPDLQRNENEAAFRLWRACIGTENPDRLLAARQVISLYREQPWAKAADINRASEPLFTAMRSEASAEGLRTVRDARTLAMQVGRDTSAATLDLTKSAFERTIAAFASIAAIIIGQTTKTLTSAQASNLRHLPGVALLVLVFWSFLLEGRVVTSSIDAFPSDLTRFSELLTEDDRNLILDAESFKSARRQAWTARIVVPLAYLGTSIVAFIVH